jgi:hypothetical protein
VLSRSEFLKPAAERFVLVELDFPRKRKLPPAQAEANAAARDAYDIRGYPTVLLLRPDGTRYAATGNKSLGPKAYLAHLDQLIAARDQGPILLAAIKNTMGVEHAQALHSWITYKDLVGDEILLEDLRRVLAADPDDIMGLRASYKARLAREERSEAMTAAQKAEDKATVRRLIAEGLADGQQDGAYRQGLHYRLAMMFLQEQDNDAAIAELDAAIAAEPKAAHVENIKKLRDAIASTPKK